jgi:DNA (cytosine-5)-methyltransferase 1
LFSGGGGLDLGLEMAGFSTAVTVEWEAYACQTLRRNRDLGVDLGSGRRYLDGCAVEHADVRDAKVSDLLAKANLAKGEAALLAGGPPCVTFSVAGKREGLMAETGRLFEDYARILKGTKPAAFLFENVKGLHNAVDEEGTPGGAFRQIRERLAGCGYALTWRIVNAADYGVPQQRERLIILGRRGRTPFDFPKPTHFDPENPRVDRAGKKPWITVEDALSGLPPAAPPRDTPDVPNHVARLHSPDVVRSFAETAPGARNPAYKRDRLRWDRPAKVIRAQGKPKPDGSGQKNSSHQSIHPVEHRQLTVRECARIQTFPDWYVFPDTFVNAYRIIGDAVPVELARILGASVLSQLSEQSPQIRRRRVALATA